MPRQGFFAALFLLLGIAALRAAEPFTVETAAWVSCSNAFVKTLALTNAARTDDGLVFSNRAHMARLFAGKRNMLLDGVSVWLHLPPRDAATNDLRDITRADFDTVFYPLLSATAAPPAKLRIVLDAGHGGEDRGACDAPAAPTAIEKEITLDIALETARILKKHGQQVWLTRSSDVYVTLPDRPRIAEQHQAQLFVSIHANFPAINPLAHGAETYVVPAAGYAITAEQNHNQVEACAGNRHDARNALLGYLLQRHCAIDASMDRGLKRARYLVLRDAVCPAALVECGFLYNSNDAARLNSRAYRRELAARIADGILDYASLTPRPPVELPAALPPPAPSNGPPARSDAATNQPAATNH
jgi:N-acetylmuramoyl-L-alanine amidase